jgi:hypothetical protein
MNFILIAILAYFGYIFLFRFVIPLYIASRKIKKGFREMHSRMQEQMNQQQAAKPEPPPKTQKGPSPSKGDYIEFEEL